MAWFQARPKKTGDFIELTESYNAKYGDYDYANDSRTLDCFFEKTLLTAVGDIGTKKILVVGSNSGYEISVLMKHFPDASFVALDIADKALEKISQKLPSVITKHANMQQLPFSDKEFDLYLNCRAIHSSDVDMKTALNEAIRVTKGRIVISISNGYLIEGKIVNGMYDYDKEEIDSERPRQISDSLTGNLKAHGYIVRESASEAELFLTADKA